MGDIILSLFRLSIWVDVGFVIIVFCTSLYIFFLSVSRNYHSDEQIQQEFSVAETRHEYADWIMVNAQYR
jgi:hypothetical protein